MSPIEALGTAVKRGMVRSIYSSRVSETIRTSVRHHIWRQFWVVGGLQVIPDIIVVEMRSQYPSSHETSIVGDGDGIGELSE